MALAVSLMDPVQRALWYVESHSHESLSLDRVAAHCHVSPYHLTRAFAAQTGQSLMRYVRARRLTEAARQLAQGHDNILSLALDAGYGSHEAFTRAFRDHFNLSPEQVRARGQIDHLSLTTALTMNATPTLEILPPRFVSTPARLLAGLVARYACESPAGIPSQWQRFAPYLQTLPNVNPPVAYGACFNFDPEGNFDYLCCVEVPPSVSLPQPLQTLTLKQQSYAVFTHPGHVSGIRATMTAIWNQWFPQAERKPVEAPMLERYGPEFNPVTGLGGFEIWIPVQ